MVELIINSASMYACMIIQAKDEIFYSYSYVLELCIALIDHINRVSVPFHHFNKGAYNQNGD